MDIRQWPMDKVMQLPDCCFGRRFAVCCEVRSVTAERSWDISQISLPERAVLWELVIATGGGDAELSYIRIAFGDQLPLSKDAMTAFEPLIPNMGVFEARIWNMGLMGRHDFALRMLRTPFFTGGRRLVLEARPPGEYVSRVQLFTVWSSFPTEVPDWLISGAAKSLL